ncbi:MAG TPA: hypothetical protein VM532_15260 [Burkholderiales bacterium]|nr:hypothetical protein [Burkholderiales bacterium]
MRRILADTDGRRNDGRIAAAAQQQQKALAKMEIISSCRLINTRIK